MTLRPTLAALALAALCSSASAAQDCDYDRCALRVSHSAGGTGVVQGSGETPVSEGVFVRRVAPLAAAGDSARTHYEASLRHQRRDLLLGAASMLAFAGSFLVADEGIVGAAAPWAAVAVGTAANQNYATGENHLRRAIWLYNRDLPAAADSGCAYDECALAVLANRTMVRGITETRLGRVGSPRVASIFAAADDSIRTRYERFRRENRGATQGMVAGLAVAVAGGVLYAVSDDDLGRGAGIAVGVGGYAIGRFAAARRAAAANQLERAVWLYNRPLPRR